MNFFHISVKGFIYFNDKYLFVRKSLKSQPNIELWELPGGGLNFGELPEDALKREIKEETGLDIKVIRPLIVWSFLKYSNKQNIGITFLCEAAGDSVKISSEHDAYKWLSKEEFETINILPELKDDMKKWMDFL